MATRWHLVAVILCASAVFCVPVDETTIATVITESDQSFGQTDVSGEVRPTVSDDGVNSNVVRRQNGMEMAEEVREEPNSRERLVTQSLGMRCEGGDVLSCFMVELTNYFDGFMARSNANPLPGDNLTQVSSPPAEPLSSSAEEPAASSRSEDASGPSASLLQLVGRKAWELARSYVLSLDLRPVADFVQEVRTRGLLSGLEKAIGAGRSEKLTGGGIDFSQLSQLSSQLPQFPQFGNNDGGNSDEDDDDDDDDDNDNDKDNSSQSTMTTIVLKTVVLGALAMKAIALLVVKVLVIMKVTAAVAVLALLFFHGFQKDISYQVVTHQKQPPPDSYEPDPHSHQEEYGGDSYSNTGGGVGGGGYGGGGGGGYGGGGNGGGYGGNGGGGYGGNGGGGDWNRNGAAHNLAYRGQRRKQSG